MRWAGADRLAAHEKSTLPADERSHLECDLVRRLTGTTIDTRTYDDGGRMLTSSYNNGVSETRAYNNDNTLASISFSGASVGDLSYNWDDNRYLTPPQVQH